RCGDDDLSGIYRHPDDRTQSVSNAVPDRARQGGAPHCPCDRAQETRLCVAVADGDCRWRTATDATLVVRRSFRPRAAQAATDQLSAPDEAQDAAVRLSTPNAAQADDTK